jgi:carbonic anhydrase
MRIAASLALISAGFLSAATSDRAHEWSYSGPSGPTHWGDLCARGTAQSPINIRSATVTRRNLPELAFHYRPEPLHIVDNGHSVEVDTAGQSSLTWGGAQFQLVQFHFHKPSEETIDGRHFDMVAHLVHRDKDGHLLVVAVPLSAGAPSPLIGTLWRNVSSQKGREVSPAGVSVDPSQLLPTNHHYFTYLGSLTTPPCTEGVRWVELKAPVFLSRSQIASFGHLYPVNARPPQPLDGRQVYSD